MVLNRTNGIETGTCNIRYYTLPNLLMHIGRKRLNHTMVDYGRFIYFITFRTYSINN